MQYLYADITISPFSEETADILVAFLSEIGYDSFEQTDNGLKAYIEKEAFDEDALRETIADVPLPDAKVSFTVCELENKDWNARWEQEHFDPILEREFGIKLNPRMAFGSGAHDTTYQITSLLLSLDFANQRVLDMGTGTGVLAIAMAKRGASEVVAIDIDEFSVENAKENFALNDLNCKSNIILGDASAIEGQYDTIVANIHKNILKADMPIYAEHLKANGTLIISGFYETDVEEMAQCAASYGLLVDEVMVKSDWAVMRMTLA